MAGLVVSVDHVAILREAGRVNYPDPVAAAVIAELAGADGIAVRLQKSRRYIKDRDIRILRETVQSKLVLNMASTPEMAGIALDVRPDMVTLVPERREEFTTQGGLDLVVNKNEISETVHTLQNRGIPVCIFVDPDPEQIKLAHKINATKVEINTGIFCGATTPKKRDSAFSKIVDAVKFVRKLKITVNAGHGLCYATIKAFKGLTEIETFSIGNSIVSRAILVGMERAVGEMTALIREL
jgi:pyridoxine 5-phosphate synthase